VKKKPRRLELFFSLSPRMWHDENRDDTRVYEGERNRETNRE